MPQYDQPSTVSFQIPVKNDSQQVIGSKTVHIVVVKSKTEQNDLGFRDIVGPLIIVFIIAATIIVISSRINSGGKIDRLLTRLERAGKFIDNKMERGDL